MRFIITVIVAISSLCLGIATGDDKPTIVATWEHQVVGRDAKPSTITLYSNSKINDPNSKNTWSRSGNLLTLHWPNPAAPGGEWIDQCTVSADGRTYSGRNQYGTRISGKLVLEATDQKSKAPPADLKSGSSREVGNKVAILEQKADTGDIPSIRQLAVCYANGDGVEKNEGKAYELMSRAAKAGDGEAMYRLSLFFRRGRGVDRDLAKADEWLKKSTLTRFDPRSLGTPGQTASAGSGGRPQINIEALERRANAGNAQSMYELGVYLSMGIGIPKDEKKAFSWLERAAKAGHVDAMNDLGCCYYYGKCVKKDLNLAKEWLTKAAQAGSPDAQRAFAKANGNTSWKDLSEEQKRLSIGLLMMAWNSAPGPTDESRRQQQEESQALRQYFRDRENQERYQQGLPPK